MSKSSEASQSGVMQYFPSTGNGNPTHRATHQWFIPNACIAFKFSVWGWWFMSFFIYLFIYLLNLKAEKKLSEKFEEQNLIIKHDRIFIQTNAPIHIFSFSITLQFYLLLHHLEFHPTDN